MKQRILNEARLLYNKNGLSAVTSRIICKSLNISLGSFSYHFSDKKNITLGLYEQMLDEIEAVYTSVQNKAPDITEYLNSHKQLFTIQAKYKFFHLNLFEILTNNSKIKALHTEKRLKEIQMAKQVYKAYMQAGILKKDTSEQHIERLINVGQILNNFWPIDAELAPKRTQKEKLVHYMKICCGLLEPYLEPQSLDQYREYFDNLEQKATKKREA